MWAFMPKYHGLPGQAARADHQTLFVGDRQADFDAELVGVASLAFGDAFHLRRVQRVELVLAGALLSSDALGAFQPHGQIAQGLRAVRLARRCTACGHRRLIRIDLALHLAHHHAEDRALALDGLAQALELFGVGVAAGLAAQRLAFLGVGLFARDAGTFGSAHHLVAGNLQQAAVHRVGDGLGLHGAVHDDALQIGGAHGLDLDRAFDGRLEQLLQAVLAQQAPEAADLGGVARQARLVVRHAANELPLHVLGPTFDQLFVAEVEAALKVQQADHQADGQTRPAGRADAAAELALECTS